MSFNEVRENNTFVLLAIRTLGVTLILKYQPFEGFKCLFAFFIG
jgi:hypothetical protein